MTASPATEAFDTPMGVPVSRDWLALGLASDQNAESLREDLAKFNIRMFWSDWPNRFDYLLSIRFSNETAPYSDHIEEISDASFFDLYAISNVDKNNE